MVTKMDAQITKQKKLFCNFDIDQDMRFYRSPSFLLVGPHQRKWFDCFDDEFLKG